MVRLEGRHDSTETPHLVDCNNVFAKFLILSFVEGYISLLVFNTYLSDDALVIIPNFTAILKIRWCCSVLFRSTHFLSFTHFFAKHTADFALLLLPGLLHFLCPFSHHQVSLHLGAPFVHPQVLSQALRRQDLISFQQSFTFSLLKLA